MTAAHILILLLALAGAACVSYGVLVLFGSGWCAITAGALLFGAAALLRRGLA